MKNRIALLLVMVAISTRLLSQTEPPPPPTSVPSSFSLLPDNLGFLENSTNLFNGSVQFSLPIVQLPYGSSSYSFALNYTSLNAKLLSTTWNREAPTGVFGLGWSFESPRIVSDFKGTGSREDDDFYILEGGQSNLLFYDGLDGSLWKFYTKNYQFWKIRYDPANETWTITKDDGTIFTYGNPSNGRNAVQYMVRWGNWVGNSNAPGGQQMAHVWDLTEITNVVGQKIYFEYLQDVEAVGSSFHTKASYLLEVRNEIGEKVRLVYQGKNLSEYDDPHVEKNEPDAYQEKYESKYVERIVRYDENDAVIFQIKLGYSFLGSGNLQKRLLNNVGQLLASGDYQANVEFQYEQNSENNYGALATVTSPTGGSTSYTYSLITLPNAKQDLYVPEISSDYAEPRIWIGEDFVVLTRRRRPSGNESTGPQPVDVEVYTWETGRWLKKDLTALVDVALKTDNGKSQDFDFAMGKDFFAILNLRRTQTGFLEYQNTRYDLYMYKRNENIPGEWHTFYQELARDANAAKSPYMDIGNEPTLVAGEDFILLGSDKSKDRHFIFRWNGTTWTGATTVKGSSDRYNYEAGPNYYIIHGYDDVSFPNPIDPDKIDFFFLDKNDQWIQKTVPSGITFFSDAEKSYWHAGSTFAVAMAADNDEFIYTWDENFDNFSRYNTGVAVNDLSFVNFFGNSTVLMVKPGVDAGGFAFRYDGQYWRTSGFMQNLSNGLGFVNIFGAGEDFIFRPSFDPPPLNGPLVVKGALRRYDGNARAWLTDWEDPIWQGSINSAVGANFFLSSGELFFRKSDGTVSNGHDTFMENQNFTALAGFDFIAGNFGSGHQFGVIFIKNGQFSGQTYIDQPYTGLLEKIALGIHPDHQVTSLQVAGNTIVTLLTYSWLDEAKALRIFRKSGDKVEGPISQYAATKITNTTSEVTVTGPLISRASSTSYRYYPDVATTDVSGNILQFNKVEVLPGVADINITPYPVGIQKYFFINGLTSNQATTLSNDPSAAFTGHLGTYLKKFMGIAYKNVSIDQAGNAVLTTETTFSYYPLQKGFFIRPLRQKVTDNTTGRIAVNDFTYHSQYGHLQSESSATLQGSTKIGEVIKTYKYWWESYDPSRAMNIFSDPIQTSLTREGNIVESQVSRWKDYSGKWFPYDSYTWRHTGTSAFTAWNVSTTPSADWEYGGKVNAIDVTTGLPLTQSDNTGQRSSQIYDYKKRNVIASLSNGAYGDFAYNSFEDASHGEFSIINGTSTNGSAKTGDKYLSLGSLAKDELTPEKSYTVSFWAKSNGGSITITGIGTINLGTLSDWTFFEYTVSGQMGIAINRSGPTEVQIDEVRIHPSEAVMTTYTYHPVYGITSKTDSNNQTMYTEYDVWGRVLNIRDESRGIIKSYTYNLKK